MSVERVPKSDTDVVVRCRKQREAPYFAPMRVERVEVMTSAAVRLSGEPVGGDGRNDADEVILDALRDLWADTDEPVRFNDLLASSGMKRTTFVRRLRSLQDEGLVEKLGKGGYALVGDDVVGQAA